jgi:hypothetical protein
MLTDLLCYQLSLECYGWIFMIPSTFFLNDMVNY